MPDAALLPQLPEVFDYHQVRQARGDEPERSCLSRVLRQLVQEGALAVGQAGVGKRGARRKKAASAGA